MDNFNNLNFHRSVGYWPSGLLWKASMEKIDWISGSFPTVPWVFKKSLSVSDSASVSHRVGNINIRISILPKYRNCFQWFFEYRNTEIQAKPISVLYRITEIQAKPISVLYRITEIQAKPISVLYRNSSQANFGIIPNYRNSSKANFSSIPNYRNFGLSEIDSALRNQRLANAPTHIQINLCRVQIHYTDTLYEYALQLTAHSVLQIDFAIICQWLFSRLIPNLSDTVNAVLRCWQAWKTVIYILLRNLFATRSALWAAMHTL